MKLKLKSQLGFGMLELLISLSVLSIVLGLSLPSIRNLQDKRAVKSESQKLAGLIENYLLFAIQSENTVFLDLNTNSYQFATANQQLYSAEITHNLNISSSSALPIQLKFYKSGVSSPKTIFINSENFSCQIIISLRSRVTSSC